MSLRSSAARAASASASAVSSAAKPAAASSSIDDTAQAVRAELIRVQRIAARDATTLWLVVLPLGVLLRILLSFVLHAQHLHASLSSRAELTNAMVSFASVQESVSNVHVARVSPYAGLSSSHAPPLLLAIFTSLLQAPTNAAEALKGLDLFLSMSHLALLATWCALDCAIALLLFNLARDHYARFPSQTLPLPWAHADARSNRVVRHLALWVASIYLLNPVTLASCVIFNLSHVTHLVLVAMILSAARGKPVATGALFGLAIYLDMYPLMLTLPVILLLHKSSSAQRPDEYPQYALDRHVLHDQCVYIEDDDAQSDGAATAADAADPLSDAAMARTQRLSAFTFKRVLKIVYRPVPLPVGAELENDGDDEAGTPVAPAVPSLPSDAALGIAEDRPWRWNIPVILLCLLSTIVSVAVLLGASYAVSGHTWSFLQASYGYPLSLPSLSPTYSLFWYFFTSVFERFRTFFLGVFHVHWGVYVLPLCVRFREEPLLALCICAHLSEVFRAYATLPGLVLGSLLIAGVNLPLLLTVRRIYLLLFLSCVAILTQGLMKFLWLEVASGNANFLFFQHTLFEFTHLLAVMEAMGAVRRRQAMVLEGRVQETIRRRKEARALLDGGATKQESTVVEPQRQESKKHA